MTREELEQMVRDLYPLYLLARAARANFDDDQQQFCITKQAWKLTMEEPFQRLTQSYKRLRETDR